MMAWQNLTDFLDSTLYGAIPATTPCTVIAGNGKRKSKYKNGLKVLVKSARKSLKKLNGTTTTIEEFVKNHTAFAVETEWTLTADGRLIHYRGPYRKKKKFMWYTIVQLDITEWLKEQSDATLRTISTAAFQWRPDGNEYIADFYRHLGR